VRVGFTGSRHGFWPKQENSFIDLISTKLSPIIEFHHGDCRGCDTEAHVWVKVTHQARIIIHPPNVDKVRSFLPGDEIRLPRSYLIRNQDIVNESDVLIAVPHEDNEVIRSGTWSTWRYANRINKPSILILPNGMIKCSGAMSCSLLFKPKTLVES